MTMPALTIVRDPGIVNNILVVEKPVPARLGAHLVVGIDTLITGITITKRGLQELVGTHDENAGTPTCAQIADH